MEHYVEHADGDAGAAPRAGGRSMSQLLEGFALSPGCNIRVVVVASMVPGFLHFFPKGRLSKAIEAFIAHTYLLTACLAPTVLVLMPSQYSANCCGNGIGKAGIDRRKAHSFIVEKQKQGLAAHPIPKWLFCRPPDSKKVLVALPDR
jgi:hypothetical protein